MWRYKAFLPVESDSNIVTLGEGLTPLLLLKSLSKELNIHRIYVKDEAQNPTGSFKARGLAMAVSKAKELGIQDMVIPTAGNAGSALSAYCAAAGIQAHIFMPKQTPMIFQQDCRVMGAHVHIIDGNISDCAKAAKSLNPNGSWFDVSTLKEPYRLEGKKTMGYEIAEQMDWKTPDWIIYPTGGGTGLIGIWQAFQEMVNMGWLNNVSTRMVAVQLDNCNPIVQAHLAGNADAIPYSNPGETIANGLRVPHAFGHKMILKTLRDSGGTAVSVNEYELLIGIREMAEKEGVFLSPEGAATYMSLKKLLQKGEIKSTDRVVLLNTGSAYKYAENLPDFR